MEKVLNFILCLFVLCLASCGQVAEHEKYYPDSGLNDGEFTYPNTPGVVIEFPMGEPLYYINTDDISVPVHARVKVNVGDPSESRELYLTGAGVRVKKVFIFSANVYVLSSYVSDLSLISLKQL